MGTVWEYISYNDGSHTARIHTFEARGPYTSVPQSGAQAAPVAGALLEAAVLSGLTRTRHCTHVLVLVGWFWVGGCLQGLAPWCLCGRKHAGAWTRRRLDTSVMAHGSDESTRSAQHAVQRVIESRDETEWILKVLAKEHTLPSAAVVCKTWAATARLLVDIWRQNILDVLVVQETTASSTHGQGISFYHPPSASALDVNGRELLHQDCAQMRIFHAGELVKGSVFRDNYRPSMVGRVEMVGGILFAVWQETVQVRVFQEDLLPWMTIETPEQRRQLRMTSYGLAWDGHRIEIPGGATIHQPAAGLG